MQNIIDHLNKLHHDDSLLDKTIIDNSIQHTSGTYVLIII